MKKTLLTVVTTLPLIYSSFAQAQVPSEDNAFYINTSVSGEECGLTWQENDGSISTLHSYEHAAKFDCTGGNKAPMYLEGNQIYTYINGQKCGFQYDSDEKSPDVLFA